MECSHVNAARRKSDATPVTPRNQCGEYPCLSRGAGSLNARAWHEIRHGLKLSPRELQIVQGIFDNKIEYTISAELGISINTLRTELRRLRRKLNVADRVSLVLRVVEEFLQQTASGSTTLPAICRDYSNGQCPLIANLSGKALPQCHPKV